MIINSFRIERVFLPREKHFWKFNIVVGKFRKSCYVSEGGNWILGPLFPDNQRRQSAYVGENFVGSDRQTDGRVDNQINSNKILFVRIVFFLFLYSAYSIYMYMYIIYDRCRRWHRQFYSFVVVASKCAPFNKCCTSLVHHTKFKVNFKPSIWSIINLRLVVQFFLST